MKISFNEFINLIINSNHFNRTVPIRTYRIIYFKSGSGQIMIGTQIYKFNPGTYAVVPPDEIYEDIVTSKTEQLICSVMVESGTIKIRGGLYNDNDSSILKLFEKIRREYQCSDYFRSEFLDLISAELFYSVIRSLNRTGGKSNTISDIIAYIDECFCDDIKIEDLARKSGYTCRHFRSLFIERTGISPSEYLLNKRMEYASHLLSHTAQSIVQISQICGFASSSQFSMLFKRFFKMTPSEYRSSVSIA